MHRAADLNLSHFVDVQTGVGGVSLCEFGQLVAGALLLGGSSVLPGDGWLVEKIGSGLQVVHYSKDQALLLRILVVNGTGLDPVVVQ